MKVEPQSILYSTLVLRKRYVAFILGIVYILAYIKIANFAKELRAIIARI